MKLWIGPAFLITATLVVAIAVALTGSTASAQTGDGYDLSWNVSAGGGAGPQTGDGYSLRSTVSQAAIGPTSAPTTELCAGYWCGVAAYFDVLLPAVLKNY
jgi:hypothetical protein